METFFGMIIGRLAGLFDGLFSHWIIDRNSGEKERKEGFLFALEDLERELHRLLTQINSSEFEKIGFNPWDRDLLERKWKAVQKYLAKEVEFNVLSEAQNAISSLGSGASLRQWTKERLTDFLNKVTWLINTADKVYDSGSKDWKKGK